MEIKLPIKWLNEKGISIENGDVYEIKYAESKTLLGSVFSLDRGEVSQRHSPPNKDSVIISFGWRRGIIKDFSIPIMAHVHEAKWKPNAEVLMEMYTEEQSAKLTEPKKETKLRLTKEDVGKKFETSNGCVYSVALVNDENAVIESETGNYYSCDLHGKCFHGANSIIKRHEPRWWLKDMPDADSFSKDVSSIHFEGDMNWYVTDVNGHDHWLPYADLPKLDDNDRKLSEMTIEYLRVWQKKNK